MRDLHESQRTGEGDLIIGAGQKSAIATLVERTSGMLLLVHLNGKRDATTVRERVGEAMSAPLSVNLW